MVDMTSIDKVAWTQNSHHHRHVIPANKQFTGQNASLLAVRLYARSWWKMEVKLFYLLQVLIYCNTSGSNMHAKKRKRVTDAMSADAAQELDQLIATLSNTVQLSSSTSKLSVFRGNVSYPHRYHKVKRMPRLQPLGSVYSSDIALRLYFCYQHANIVTNDEESSSESKGVSAIDSPQKFAELCVIKLKLELSRRAYRYVVRVWLPEGEDLALGAINDRILVQICELAGYNNVYAVDKCLSAKLAPLKVIFRDDAVIVVDKVANMLSVDGTDSDAPASVHRCIATVYPEARMVHRLDQETSGLLVVALSKSAAQSLNAQFRSRSVEKYYVARVLGWMDEEKENWTSQRCVRVPMEKHPTQPLVQHVIRNRKVNPSSSLWSVTEYFVQSRAVEASGFNNEDEQKFTIVKLKPVTGKTHQLRLHMQYLEHPILGDSLYSPDLVYHRASRLCLHAEKLSFTHPVTNERMSFTSPCPADFFTNKEDKNVVSWRPQVLKYKSA
ncbi:putative pseudouridine synthase, RsuA/RluB/C/D/E/F [Plasmopara halstedii]